MDIGFFLKKSISYCVEPFGMVVLLLVFGVFFLLRKKEKIAKYFISLGVFFMLLYAYPPFSNFLITQLEAQYPKYKAVSEIEYIHVLGNGHSNDTSQPLSSRMGSTSLSRDIEGILIHFATPNSKLIFTGFAGKLDISTAQMNTNFALALGVQKENILLSESPKDTKEEALFTKTIVGEKPFVLVTSASHMPRAMMLFRSVGLKPIAAPTNFRKQKYEGFFYLPNVGSFSTSQVAMHEYLGMLWSKLKS